MSLNDSNYLENLFVNEAKKALEVSRGGGGSSSDDTQTYILVDEAGNEIPAVLVEEKTVFTATENDIREGTIAATEKGVTVGTKEIPAYITTEGVQLITAGKSFVVRIQDGNRYNYTKFQAILCPVTSTLNDAVAADKVVIEDKVYAAGSSDPISTVTLDHDNKSIDLGVVNDTSNIYVIRYFTYKEE